MSELNRGDAYAAILTWYRSNVQAMKQIYDRRDKYSKLSKRLIGALPDPAEAADDDTKFVAREVLTGLLEWGYHQRDNAGVPMHMYARHILGEEGLGTVGMPRDENLRQILQLRRDYFRL